METRLLTKPNLCFATVLQRVPVRLQCLLTIDLIPLGKRSLSLEQRTSMFTVADALKLYQFDV